VGRPEKLLSETAKIQKMKTFCSTALLGCTAHFALNGLITYITSNIGFSPRFGRRK